MVRAATAQIVVQEGQIYTGGGIVPATIKVNVHKSEAYMGTAFLSLTCEEWAQVVCESSIVTSQTLADVPTTLPRGSHTFSAEFVIPQTVSQYPSRMEVADPKHRVGVYWKLNIGFTNTDTTAETEVQVYPSRPLSGQVWEAELNRDSASESEFSASMQSTGIDASAAETAGADDITRGHDGQTVPRYCVIDNAHDSRRSDCGEENHTVARSDGVRGSTENPSRAGRGVATNDRHHIQTNLDGRDHHHTQTATRHRGFREISHRGTVIISKNDSSRPMKTTSRIFIALFGERYRHPEKGELEEIQIRSRLYVPNTGVLQSPHKAGLRLTVWTPRDDSVMLSSVLVKLITHTWVLHTGKVYTTTCEILDLPLEIRLESGTCDLTGELADLEIPTVCESTDTDYLRRRYEVRVTLVFRAVHLSNISRWHTIQSPLHVLPSIVQMAGLQHASMPPPYHG